MVQKIEYPIWVVYVTQAMMFGGGLLGISYGILSTSWDPRREGSALGWTELQVGCAVCWVVAWMCGHKCLCGVWKEGTAGS